MKVLFLGDYSGLHATVANTLRSLGHECVVVSDGSRCMDTKRDINLKRESGLVNSFRYLSRAFNLIRSFKGFDVVQIINPGFVHLRPDKLRYLFKTLKNRNGAVCLSLAGTDSFYAKSLLDTDLFRYSEYKVGSNPTPYALHNNQVINEWIAPELMDYCRFVYDNIDGAVSAIYEYHIAAQNFIHDKPVVYGGIPVDIDALSFKPLKRESDSKVTILAGIKSEMTLFKGTDRLLTAAQAVELRHPDKCEVLIARDLPLTEYLNRLERADIILDQLYSYSPATNALQAMAMGKIAVSGGEPEFYDFLGESTLRPIINAVPNDNLLVEILESLVLSDASLLEKLSSESRLFVEKHNDSRLVANNYLKAWEKMIK
ncbi:MAG: glycosyltransferase [Muribaculaceae bacterium]|nr:glycosyltransferase [Muribaculaceae bacterium]